MFIRGIKAESRGGFPDAAAPVEIAYFDRGPLDEKGLVLAVHGLLLVSCRIYGHGDRALPRVLNCSRECLSQSGSISSSVESGTAVHPQQQFPATWPSEPVSARAYVDHLGAAPTGGRDARDIPQRSRSRRYV